MKNSDRAKTVEQARSQAVIVRNEQLSAKERAAVERAKSIQRGRGVVFYSEPSRAAGVVRSLRQAMS